MTIYLSLHKHYCVRFNEWPFISLYTNIIVGCYLLEIQQIQYSSHTVLLSTYKNEFSTTNTIALLYGFYYKITQVLFLFEFITNAMQSQVSLECTSKSCPCAKCAMWKSTGSLGSTKNNTMYTKISSFIL